MEVQDSTVDPIEHLKILWNQLVSTAIDHEEHCYKILSFLKQTKIRQLARIRDWAQETIWTRW